MTDCIRRPHSVWTTCTCGPCTIDRNRMTKLQRNGLYKRVPAEAAVDVLHHLRTQGWSIHAIGSAAGLHYQTTYGAIRGGVIGPTVARKIVNHGDPTDGSVGATGTTRRLRGLAVQGYNLQQIADDTGIKFSTLAAIRQGNTTRVRSSFYTTLRDYTNAREMTDGGSESARRHARHKNWAGLLAYDDIDDPTEMPIGVPRDRKKKSA